MSDRNRNILEALERIDLFAEVNPNLATELPSTVEMFAANKLNINRFHQAGITKISAHSAGISHTQSKAALAREMNGDLRRVANAAKRIEKKNENFTNRFILPRGRLSYRQIIDFANSFAENAPPHETDFVKYALTAQFFNELKEDAADLNDDTREQAGAKGAAVGANADLEAIVEDALDVRDDLKTALEIYYRNHPAKLAEWLTACHIERSRNKKKPDAPPTEPDAPGKN